MVVFCNVHYVISESFYSIYSITFLSFVIVLLCNYGVASFQRTQGNFSVISGLKMGLQTAERSALDTADGRLVPPLTLLLPFWSVLLIISVLLRPFISVLNDPT